jgi:NADH-quinone oxidoreductase subunit H
MSVMAEAAVSRNGHGIGAGGLLNTVRRAGAIRTGRISPSSLDRSIRNPMCGTRSITSWVGLLAVALSVGACARETTPPLIQVLEVTPRELEQGDHLEIRGTGFPEGKLAHVAFLGDLYRPGVEAVRGIEIDVEAVATSGSEVDVPVSDAAEKLFVGSGERAAHTTFVGEISVAFAAATPAAPPVAGTLHDVWVDVRPAGPHRAIAEAEADEGVRSLQFLGIKAQDAVLPSGGILVESIEPASRAEAARLLAGDVLTEWAGVRVLSTRDLVCVPGARSVDLKIRRGGAPYEQLARVSLVGLTPPLAAALLSPVLILGLAAIVLLLFFAPTPSVVAWFEQSIAARLRLQARARFRGFDVASIARHLGVGTSPLAVAGAVAAVTAVFALLPFGHYLGEIDVGILFVLALTSIATLAVLTGGATSLRPYSFTGGVAAAGRLISRELPAAFALVAVVMLAGSLRLEDIVRSQTGWPTGWTFFKSPFAFVLLALAFVMAIADDEVATSPLPDADDPAGPFSGVPRLAANAPSRVRLFGFAQTAKVLTMGAMVVALFLGGWQIPGLAPEQVDAHLGWALLGAVLFAAKSWLVILAYAMARRTLPVTAADQTLSLCWRWLVPLSLATLLLLGVWATWGPGPSAETLVGGVMLALTVAGSFHIIMSVRLGLMRAEERVELDPFL